MRLLKPDLILASVFDLDFAELRKLRIAGLLIDIDNTLVPWEQSLMGRDFVSWARQAEAAGISLCLISNALEKRVEPFAELLGIPAVGQAWKPLNRAFLRGVALLGLPAERVAVVGDQLFTDVFGGNRLGMFTVLINPLSTEEFFITKLVRKVEAKMLKRMVKKGWLCAEAVRARLKGN